MSDSAADTSQGSSSAGITRDAPDQPRRVLSTLDATCVVIGAIIGTGIFLSPSSVAKLVDSNALVLLAWGLGGAIALCGALVFAELGTRYNASGAQYTILRDTCGPLPAFLFVFCNATGTQAGAIGIIGTVCTRHLCIAAGGESLTGYPLIGVSALLIVILAVANIVGVRWGSRIQNFTVYCKVLTLLAITGIAVFASRSEIALAAAAEPATRLSPWAGVLAALVPAFFAYGGWQQALWISGEVRNPRRAIPRAIIIGMVLVVAIYLLANWAYLRLLGLEGVASSEAIASDAVATVYPDIGRRVIAAAVGLSAFGVLNSQLLSGPRLIFGMARDGRFFEVFGKLSPRFGTPVAAICMLAGTAIALLLVAGRNGIVTILNGAVFIDCIFFVLTGAALIVLRKRDKAAVQAGDASAFKNVAGKTFRIPLFPLIPILFILGEIGGLVGTYLDPAVRDATYVGAAWIVVGAILYAVRFNNKPPLHA
ncbi:MAG: amino acid permease [Pyrinomonadaceae bacterium]|nr:amino acid permease [Phycisphaerales bacterium]